MKIRLSHKITILIYLLLLISCVSKKNVILIGRYNETNWGPMKSRYIFFEDGTFEKYYSDDTFGTYGKGIFELNNKILSLKYDSLIINNPIKITERKTDSDSTFIQLRIFSGVPLYARFFSENIEIGKKEIKRNFVSLTLGNNIKKFKVQVFEDFVIEEEKRFEFEIEIGDFNYYEYEFYPSNSWYKFNTEKDRDMKLRKLHNEYFEIHIDNYKWTFKRE